MVASATFPSVTFSLDTSAYASGEVLADTQVITDAMLDKNVPMKLESILLLDEDDQGVAFDIYLFDSLVSLGTENGVVSITDANMRSCLGIISVATADWKDLGGSRVANIKNIGLVVKAATDSRDLYVGIVNGTGTPTFTASGLKAKLAFSKL